MISAKLITLVSENQIAQLALLSTLTYFITYGANYIYKLIIYPFFKSFRTSITGILYIYFICAYFLQRFCI